MWMALTVTDIAVIIGALAGVLLLWFAIWSYRKQQRTKQRGRLVKRRIRQSEPTIIAEGREEFVRATETAVDKIVMKLGTGLKELHIKETDPGANILTHLIDTAKQGESGRLDVFTEKEFLSSDFWEEVVGYASDIAKLEEEFFDSDFFEKVVRVAAATDPLALAMTNRKKPFSVLIRTVPQKFHRAFIVARAAEKHQKIHNYLKANFDLKIAPGQIGRYIWLRVLSNVCSGVTIKLEPPKLLDELGGLIDRNYKELRGAKIESDLIPQASNLRQLLATGHIVLVALGALGIKLRG